MIFETTHKVENNVFSVTVAFEGYGTDDMDEAHEQALFNDLGNPVINLGSIVFKGKFKVDGDKRVVFDSTDADPDADEVSFIVNAKRLELTEGFTATYAADAGDVATSEIGAHLNTARLVAEAKALLFQEKVHAAIKEAVEALKAQRTRFETDAVATLTV